MNLPKTIIIPQPPSISRMTTLFLKDTHSVDKTRPTRTVFTTSRTTTHEVTGDSFSVFPRLFLISLTLLLEG